MTNLLKETIGVLHENGRSPKDVLFITAGDAYCFWPEFENAINFEYDSGYGSQLIFDGLKVVGQDWWLERSEYDGSEWWEFKTMPLIPVTRTKELRLLSYGDD